MTRLRWPRVVAAACVVAAVSLVVTLLVVWRGFSPLPIMPLGAFVMVFVAAVLMWCGRAVLRLKERERTWITPVQAVNVVTAAHVCAWFGGVFAGYMIGQALVPVIVGSEAPMLVSHALWAGVNAVAAGVLSVSGFVVESWCTIDDDEDTQAMQVTPA